MLIIVTCFILILKLYYCCRQVPYTEIDKKYYYTASRHGVTLWSESENVFTDLDEWLAEYDKYKTLMKIKLFHCYRIWKSFKNWYSNIKIKKFTIAQRNLEENLFIAIPPLGAALLELKDRLNKLRRLKFVQCDVIENWHLFYFLEKQMILYEETRDKIIQFRKDVKSLLCKHY